MAGMNYALYFQSIIFYYFQKQNSELFPIVFKNSSNCFQK